MHLDSESKHYINAVNDDKFQVINLDITKMGSILETISTSFKFYAERKDNHKKSKNR